LVTLKSYGTGLKVWVSRNGRSWNSSGSTGRHPASRHAVWTAVLNGMLLVLEVYAWQWQFTKHLPDEAKPDAAEPVRDEQLPAHPPSPLPVTALE
jgi:hypothetical protein